MYPTRKAYPTRTPTETLDSDGRKILLVPLANSDLHARIFPEDYQRLREAGYSGNWCWNCGYVKVGDWRTNTLRVARLIVNPDGDFRVRHKDRNPLNLRSDNLVLQPFKRTKQRPKKAS